MSLQLIVNPDHQVATPSPQSPISEQDPENSPRTKKKWWKVLLVILSLILLGGSITVGVFVYLDSNRLMSPLGQAKRILGFGDITEKPNRIVYGFLPYWNYKYLEEIRLDQLTHLALFGIHFEDDGSIQVYEQDYIEPGYRNVTSDTSLALIDSAHDQNVNVLVTLIAFDNETIESIISSPENSQRLISQVTEFVQEYNLDGVNIDFEYVGSPDQTLRTQFSNFTRKLTTALKQADPDYHVSVSVFADSAENNRIWELEPLSEAVDHIIIMGYDFYRASSSEAGPVAPVFGAGQLWSQDLTSLLAKHMEINRPNKLILGVPFYGYEWQTSTTEYLSPTVSGTGGAATYRRVQELISTTPTIRNWNNQALAPWLWYEIDENIYQIQYEDTRSLGFKYDLVNQTNLAGIAIWALGYEGPTDDMWRLIEDKF